MLTTRKILYFEENGIPYDPALCPGMIIRGRVGDCFDTAILNVLANGFTYVEGIASHPLTGGWIYHAWLTDGTGRAYDPTWKAERHGIEFLLPIKYIGLPLKTEPVLEFMRETEYKALFENGWRNPELFRKALPDWVPEYKFIGV